jgi:hypothetical protein
MTDAQRFVTNMAALSVVGSVVIILDHSYAHLDWPAAIGEALLVAGILGLTVDPRIKKQLASEGFEAALRAAHGRHLPSGVQDAIRRLGTCNLARYGFDVTFTFRGHSPTSVVVTTTIEFEVRNVGTQSENFAHTIVLHKVPSECPIPPRAVVARCRIDESKIYDHCEQEISLSQTDEGWSWQEEVQIPAGKSAWFLGETERVLPRRWLDVFYFSHPTIGAKVRAHAPDGTEIGVIFQHSSKQQTQVHTDRSWELKDAAFLPQMSFFVRWAVPTDDISESSSPTRPNSR